MGKLVSYFKSKIKEIVEYDAEIDAIHVSTMQLHQKTFSQFKNCNRGKSLVVCGAGPTLQRYRPIEGAVHIALNRAFLYEKVNFDYIFAQDWDGINMVQEELIAYRPDSCIKFLGCPQGKTVTHKIISESYALRCNALRFNTDDYIYCNGYRSKFVKDIESRALGNMPNVGLSVMQFALYTNPKKLYIVGCDMSGTHFSSGNQTQQEIKEEKEQLTKYWKSDQKKLLAKWEEFKGFARIYYPETKIISVNPVGLRGMFEDLDQE